MLNKTVAIFSISALMFQVSSGVVLAVENTTSTNTTEKTMQQRITERKSALKTKLDTATQTKLKAKCVASQKLVTAAKLRSDKAIENRQKAYDAVQTRLDALLTALEKNNIDTSTVQALQTQVKTAIDKLKADAEAYSQTIADLSAMDCTADPTGFKATLDTARTQRQQLAKDLAELKTLKGKIISELAKIKTQNASIKNPNTTDGGTR